MEYLPNDVLTALEKFAEFKPVLEEIDRRPFYEPIDVAATIDYVEQYCTRANTILNKKGYILNCGICGRCNFQFKVPLPITTIRRAPQLKRRRVE
jgi:hypothetical protein